MHQNDARSGFINSEHFNSPWTQPAEPEHGTGTRKT